MTNPAELFVDGHRFIDVGERILEGRYLVRVLRSHCAGCGGAFEQLQWTTGPAALPPVRHCMTCTTPAQAVAPPAQEQPAPALVVHAKPRHARRVPDAVAPPPTGIDDVVYHHRAGGHKLTVGVVVQALLDHSSMTQALKALRCDTYDAQARIGKVLTAAGWAGIDGQTNAYAPTLAGALAVRERARAGDRP